MAELSERPTPIPAPPGARVPPAAASLDGSEPGTRAERRLTAEVDGRRFEVRLFYEPDAAPAGAGGPARPERRRRPTVAAAAAASDEAGSGSVTTPMQGTVLRVLVEQGGTVAVGDVICIVEAMKMENEVAALRAGTVRELNVSEGQAVQAGQVIAVVE
jgi:acetyl-CoA/propionyl-CoA carboxylase biotin carboxyl carrier protein